MDEDLLKLLDDARKQGANETQLQGIVDLYKKKSPASSVTPSIDGSTTQSEPSSDSSVNVLPDSLKPAQPFTTGAGSSLLRRSEADIDSIASGQPANEPEAQPAIPADNKPTPVVPDQPDGSYSPQAFAGSFNKGLAHVSDAFSGLFTVINAANNLGKNNDQKAQGNMGMKLFDWASDYLKGTAKDNPLPNTFVGNAVDATVGTIPTVIGAGLTGGESTAAEFLPAVTKSDILQTALTKAAAPLTQYLATTKTLEGVNTAYKASGGDFKQTVLGGVEGFNEGVESGVSLEAQMAAGGQIGGALYKKMVEAGIVNEGGALTEQALKSFIGTPSVFAASSVADDLIGGRPINWQNAGISAVTALPFEAPHIFEAYNQSRDNAAATKTLNKAVNDVIATRDNNAIVNFASAEPGDIFTAMQRPESSQDLQVMAIQKGMDAQKADNYQDKNTLHLEQLELQKQADIKKLGETVINSGVDGFVQAVNHTELPDETKTSLLNKAQAVNQVFNPIEVKKTEIGRTIDGLNTQIQQLHQTTFTGDASNIKSDNLVQLNDLIGQRVQAQSDLFDLSYGDDQKQKQSVNVANAVAANPVTNPETITTPKAIIPIDNEFLSDAHLTDVKPNGDVTVRQSDGTDETISDEDRKALGITDDHIQQFKDANTQAAQETPTVPTDNIPVTESKPLDLNPQEGETEFEHKLRTITDPGEIAKMYDDHINNLQDNLGIDGAIADYRATVTPAEFAEHDDRNNVTPAIARNYFSKKGDRIIGIDNQADEINRIYFNGADTVQPADITDFMVRHPGGHASYFTPQGNDELAAINVRYKEITGKNLRKDIASKLAAQYNVSQKLAHQDAEIVNTSHNLELLGKRVESLVHDNGPFEGLPDMDKVSSEFDNYVADPKNDFNMWYDVFNGRAPHESEIEFTKNVIDEQRANQGSGSGATEKPAAESENRPSEPAGENGGEPSVTASTTEPQRVADEYDQRIADHDDKIAKAESALKKAEKGINDANDLFASSGVAEDGKKDGKLFKEPADVSKENTDRILKPLRDQLNGLKQEREVLLAEKEKAVEQAGRQTQFTENAASKGDSGERIDPETQEKVKTAMANIFPGIVNHYYDSVEDFNKAAEENGYKKALQQGTIVRAFVDKNREVHFNPDYINKDTQLHEQGHILTNWAYHYAPELYKRIIETGKTLGYIHKQLRDNGYDSRGDAFFEEAFITAQGHEGAKRLDEIVPGKSQRGTVSRIIHEAWTKLERWIAGRTGFSISKFKNLQDMKFDEFSKYINDKYLFSDVKISDVTSKDLADKNSDIGSKAQQSAKPVKQAGESLGDFAKRVADWADENDRRANEDKATPPDKMAGSTNTTQQFGGDWELPPETLKEHIQRRGQDAMNRVRVAQEQIEKAGGNIGRDEDYYNHQRRVTGIAEHQIDMAHEDIFKSKDKKKPALMEQMKAKGVSQTDMGLYLYAKHAEERNRENASTRQQAFNAERTRVENRLNEARTAGNKKNETYFKNKLEILDKNENKKYPLMNDGGSGMTNAQAKEILDNFEKEGRTKDLEQLAQKYKADVTDKQLKYDLDSGRISQEDYDHLKDKYKNYVPLQVQEYVDAKNSVSSLNNLIKVKSAFQRSQGAAARDFNQRVNPFSYGIVQLERSIVEGEKNKLVNTMYNLVEQNPNDKVWEIIHPKYKVTYKADGSVDKLDNITDESIKKSSLYGFKDGKPFYIHIKDPILKQEINKEGMKNVHRYFTNVSSFLRNGLTVYNPSFWVPNFIKDTFSAGFNLSTQQTDGLVQKYIKSIPSAMNGIIQYNKGNRDHPDAKIFKSYLENGAELTYSRYDQDIEKLKNIADYFNETPKNKLNPTVWVPKLGEYMNHMSELLELTTRVAAYKGAVDSGIPEHKAAVLSKEATVDFSQKGEFSPVFNSLYLFGNAGVQGANTFFKNIAKDPKVAGKVIGGAIAAGFLSAAINQQSNGTPNPDGSDDANDYNRISDFEKQGNFIIRNPIGGGFIKIPLGHELGVFPYMGDKIYNYITGHASAGETATGIASYAMSAYSPVSGGDLLQTAAPTILDPAAQIYENKNSFGSPVYKKIDDNSVVPQSQSHFQSTDPIYVNIADKLHKWTGGSGAKAGYVELPPDLIPWAVQTVTGGAGKTATQTVDAVANTLRLQPTEIKKIPVLYRFYTTGSDKNYRSNVIGILDKSAQNNVSAQDQTTFYQDAMKAVLKGEIDDKAYERYINTFQNNMQRVKLSEQFPNATPDELKEMMKK